MMQDTTLPGGTTGYPVITDWQPWRYFSSSATAAADVLISVPTTVTASIDVLVV